MPTFFKKIDFWVILILLVVSVPLRFVNLGYSEFQDDEKKATVRLLPNQTLTDFFLSQRKGPLQFLITSATIFVTGDKLNEFAVRFPFTLLNLASVIVFYLLIKKLTNNTFTALFSALLYSVNGFVIGFSRIAQYQNLNLFFSLLALLMYAGLITDKKRMLLKSLLGTAFLCISILSHWDAVFYLVPLIFIFVKFWKDKSVLRKEKLYLLKFNLLLGGVLLLPFLVPYIYYQCSIPENLAYFDRRMSINSSYSFARHLFIIHLYNPYFFVEALAGLCLVSLAFVKKNWLFLVWGVVNFVFIKIFMEKPGTHIYNYVIPLLIFVVVGVGELAAKKFWLIKVVVNLLAAVLIGVLFYQSYILFVDHNPEYPWQSKPLFNKITTPYVDEEILTFGFPHKRDWKYIDSIITGDSDRCTYITNEAKGISQIYVRAEYGVSAGRSCYYIVVVKYPFVSIQTNYNFAAINGRGPVYKYKVGDEILTKVYKISKGK